MLHVHYLRTFVNLHPPSKSSHLLCCAIPAQGHLCCWTLSSLGTKRQSVLLTDPAKSSRKPHFPVTCSWVLVSPVMHADGSPIQTLLCSFPASPKYHSTPKLHILLLSSNCHCGRGGHLNKVALAGVRGDHHIFGEAFHACLTPAALSEPMIWKHLIYIDYDLRQCCSVARFVKSFQSSQIQYPAEAADTKEDMYCMIPFI